MWAYSKIFSSAWVDDELLDFLKSLQDRDWTQIDWNREWMVIPILPEAALAYCMPGILCWFFTDFDAGIEVIEGLVDFSLARAFLEPPRCRADLFNSEQRRLIADVVLMLRDSVLKDKPELQKIATDIIMVCLEDEKRLVPRNLG
jgi:hypothetical protein